MNDERNNQGPKVVIAVFVAILVLLCIGGGYTMIHGYQQPAASPQLLTVPTPELNFISGAHVYLPVIALKAASKQVEPGSILIALPTEAPTETPSNLWRVTQIFGQSYYFHGYVYDLAVFENVRTGENIKAFCADPGWPGPNPGDFYIRNEWNVLVPVHNDNPPWIQRFIVINP